MRIRMIKMFTQGVEVPHRLLNDRYTLVHRGKLEILDTTDQGRHRPVKVARLISHLGVSIELFDVQIVWLNAERMTLTGDERVKNRDGQTVCFKQSWLCMLDADNIPLPPR